MDTLTLLALGGLGVVVLMMSLFFGTKEVAQSHARFSKAHEAFTRSSDELSPVSAFARFMAHDGEAGR